MSRGQLARTPANFPRMKHRAAGRLAKRAAAKKRPPTWGEIFQPFANIGKAAGGFLDGLVKLLSPAPTQHDFVLMPPIVYHPPTMMDRQELQQKLSAIPGLPLQRGQIGR